MASLRTYTMAASSNNNNNRRSNSRNRFHNHQTAFVANSQKRARSYRASNHMQASCENKQKMSNTANNNVNTASHEKGSSQEKECVKLVTYPIMQV